MMLFKDLSKLSEDPDYISRGSGIYIHKTASVDPSATIEKAVIIGPRVFIDKDVRIGYGCQIYPRAKIFKKVSLGACCKIGAGACIWSDTYLGDDVNLGRCVFIRERCSIGSKCEIGDHADVLADTVLLSDSLVPPGGVLLPSLGPIRTTAFSAPYCTKAAHHLMVRSDGIVTIGCKTHSIANWLSNYEDLGRSQGMSEQTIRLYAVLLRAADEWIKIASQDLSLPASEAAEPVDNSPATE